jgi:hypothetical protein
MNAQETIAAAIQRLEAIRFVPVSIWREGWPYKVPKLALRRSVEAQIAILRQAHAELEPFNGVRLADDAVQRELALARAILGESE